MSPAEAKGFLAQFDKSRAEVARLKVDMPYLFPAWQHLKAAEEEFAQAQEKLRIAQQRWEKT